MTQEEATNLANDNNTILGAEITATIKYKVYAYWEPNLIKAYNVLLIPTKYEAQFNVATESQAIAFQRVSIKTIATTASGAEAATFVTNYDANKASDVELLAYLP